MSQCGPEEGVIGLAVRATEEGGIGETGEIGKDVEGRRTWLGGESSGRSGRSVCVSGGNVVIERSGLRRYRVDFTQPSAPVQISAERALPLMGRAIALRSGEVSLSLHAAHTRGFPNGARTTMHSHSRGAPTVSLRHAPAVLCRSFPHASLSNYAFPIAPRANHHATRPPVRWQLRESPFVIPVCQLKCW